MLTFARLSFYLELQLDERDLVSNSMPIFQHYTDYTTLPSNLYRWHSHYYKKCLLPTVSSLSNMMRNSWY